MNFSANFLHLQIAIGQLWFVLDMPYKIWLLLHKLMARTYSYSLDLWAIWDGQAYAVPMISEPTMELSTQWLD